MDDALQITAFGFFNIDLPFIQNVIFALQNNILINDINYNFFHTEFGSSHYVCCNINTKLFRLMFIQIKLLE